MPLQIRTANIDSLPELEGIAAIVNQFDQEPSSPEDIRRIFTHLPPGRITCRLVAADDQNRIKGYACAVHEAFSPAGYFYAWVGVDAASRRQGVGHTLQAELGSFLSIHKATRLVSEVKDDDPPSLHFAEKLGFFPERHLFHSVLDLGEFDDTPYRGLIEKQEGQGLRFTSLAALGDTPEARRQAYELDAIVTQDVPGTIGPFMQFDEYEKRVLSQKSYAPEGRLLALDGEKMVGFATVAIVPASGNAHNDMTGVLAEYRGRRIALALKLLAIRYAREAGAREITTSNDSLNEPMLAINRKLGYRPQTGVYKLRCDQPVFN